MFGGIAPPDPFLLTEPVAGAGFRDTKGLANRSQVINPAVRNLVLITAGQSNWASVNPTLYTATNASVIDNANIYDGAFYASGGPLLGCSNGGSPLGPGNISLRLADALITNGKFDRVILCPIAIGATVVSQWGDTGGILSDRVGCQIRRLASRGIIPGMTGVTFALILGLGETDNTNGTSQAAWTASFNSFVTKTLATGFSGRIFVPQETWNGGVTSTAVRAAQSAVVDNITVFSGGDLDTLNATNRQADNLHLNDTGAPAGTTIEYNAMHASGAPF